MIMTPGARGLFDRLMPPQQKPIPVESNSKTAVVAKLEATIEGVCPYCQSNMRKTRVGDLEAWVCDGDRHVAPIRTE